LSAENTASGTGLEPDILKIRRELITYLHRLVVHPQNAEDLVQEAFMRSQGAANRAPTEPEGYRKWMFRIATNLAIDHLRRERRWRRYDMQAIRDDAEADPAFVERSKSLVGTPETSLLAREHLAACFACTMSNLSERQAAALLLVEVHGFSVQEAAETLEIGFNSAKNAVQEARRTMTARYDATCALIAKQGVCHQCEELAEFFGAEQIALQGDKWDARIERLRELREQRPGVWHTLLLGRLRRSDKGPS
jgi:RNA polymerase sigma-70 factor (ECF subfamily)